MPVRGLLRIKIGKLHKCRYCKLLRTQLGFVREGATVENIFNMLQIATVLQNGTLEKAGDKSSKE
jgi:hypothetical protein